MSAFLFLATAAAGFLYVIAPGPAFLAVFTLAAAKGRAMGARFLIAHLVGDVFWGALAFAAIIGVSAVGPTLFDLLGAGCGLYLVYLGVRAVMTRKTTGGAAIGAQRPFVTGVLFGLTNPKAYPVSVAMYTAVAVPFAGRLTLADAPGLMGAAFVGFVLADAVVIFSAGLPLVRRLFSRHALAITRAVGVLFIAFGAKSLLDAGRGLAARG
ncbi:MAG: LysE family transporter [Methylobacteriaceae bacterium]|nr:LysE family transporter [Methylobacteriaceae bacterium]